MAPPKNGAPLQCRICRAYRYATDEEEDEEDEKDEEEKDEDEEDTDEEEEKDKEEQEGEHVGEEDENEDRHSRCYRDIFYPDAAVKAWSCTGLFGFKSMLLCRYF